MSTFITEVPGEKQLNMLRTVAWERGLDARVDAFLATSPTPYDISASIQAIIDPAKKHVYPVLAATEGQLQQIVAMRVELFGEADSRPMPTDRAWANRAIAQLHRMRAGKRWAAAQAQATTFFAGEGSPAPKPQTLSAGYANPDGSEPTVGVAQVDDTAAAAVAAGADGIPF